jgi:hypothetical protein
MSKPPFDECPLCDAKVVNGLFVCGHTERVMQLLVDIEAVENGTAKLISFEDLCKQLESEP